MALPPAPHGLGFFLGFCPAKCAKSEYKRRSLKGELSEVPVMCYACHFVVYLQWKWELKSQDEFKYEEIEKLIGLLSLKMWWGTFILAA